MQVPPEIAFREVEPSDELKALVLEGIEKLEGVYPGLISCRTVIADTTPGQQTGNEYRVRLEIGIPGRTVMVEESDPESTAHRDVTQTIKEAFSVARKRLQQAKEQQRGDVKPRALPPHGRVTRLLIDDTGTRYGFLESREGRQVYFQEAALVDMDFDDLEVGDEVRFAAVEGDDGLQASTVGRLDLGSIGPSQEDSVPLT